MKMLKNYRFEDVKNKSLYIGVECHYVKLTDGKQAYWDSKQSDRKDDSIYIEIGIDGGQEILSNITLGVDEAEKFALDLLNLCHLIRF